MEEQEFVPSGRVIWQSDTAKTYQCPICYQPVYTQHEGDDLPLIQCQHGAGHIVTWLTAQ